MLGRLREGYERALRPLGMTVARLGIPPNLITMLSLAIASGCGYALYLGHLYLGVALLALAGFMDILDGAVARALGKATGFGSVLDKVSDRYVEFALLLGLMLGGFLTWWWGVFALFGMVMASYARAEAHASLGGESVRGGLMERQEKLILLAIGALLYPVFTYSIDYAAIVVGSLSHATVVQRLVKARRYDVKTVARQG